MPHDANDWRRLKIERALVPPNFEEGANARVVLP
jgi:hypothetical protein